MYILGPEQDRLDLPILTTDTPILKKKEQFRATATRNDSAETFFRRVNLVKPDWTKIDRFLEWADEELADIAMRCGAMVVDHTWGLYPSLCLPVFSRKSDSIDSGAKKETDCIRQGRFHKLKLAAEVAIIEPIDWSIKDWIQVSDGVKDYIRDRKESKAPMLLDQAPYQFENGIQRTDRTSGIYLLDLDLISIRIES
jgi:hypothetical protein